MAEETGNGVTPTLTGSAAHRLASNGEFVASNGTTANDGYALISNDTFTDSILRTDNLSDSDSSCIFGHLFYSSAPAANECIFSYGNGATGESHFELLMLSSGNLQFTVDDGTTQNQQSFGSAKFGYGAYFPFMIAFYGDTGTFDFMIGTIFEQDDPFKTGYNYNGVSPDPRGLCLFANNIYNDQRNLMGADATITSKLKGLTFSRFSKYVNMQNIIREANQIPGRQLRSLYNGHS